MIGPQQARKKEGEHRGETITLGGDNARLL